MLYYSLKEEFPIRHGQYYEQDVALSRALEQSALDSSDVASKRSAGLEAKGQVRHISLGGMLLALKPNRFSSRRCLLLLKITAFYPIGDVLSKTGKRLAIPLCLPNNCRWDSKKSQYLQTGEKRHSLYVVEEALEKLRKIKGTLFTKVL